MNELFHDDYYSARVDHGILRLVRSGKAYPSIEVMNEANRAMTAAVRASGMRRVLLDLRGGPPGRNDAAFEAAVAPWRKLLADQCERVAVLVKTIAGKLQTQRMARSEGRPENTFMDEEAALKYLKG